MHPALLNLNTPAPSQAGAAVSGDAKAQLEHNGDEETVPEFSELFEKLTASEDMLKTKVQQIAKSDVAPASEDAEKNETPKLISETEGEETAKDLPKAADTRPEINARDSSRRHPEGNAASERSENADVPELRGNDLAAVKRDHLAEGRTVAAEATQRSEMHKARNNTHAALEGEPVAEAKDGKPMATLSDHAARGLDQSRSSKPTTLPQEAILAQRVEPEKRREVDVSDRSKPTSRQTADPAILVQAPFGPRTERSYALRRMLPAQADEAATLKPQVIAAPTRPAAAATAAPTNPVAETAQNLTAKDSASLLQPVSDRPPELHWDQPRTAHVAASPALTRAETPVMVARQMAEALQRMPDRPVELTLNPEELGRVRMSITAADVGITVNVLAERVETLEMLRRHIDQLAQEFQSMGYEEIAFSFGEGTQGSEGENDNGPKNDATTAMALDLDPAAPSSASAHLSSGIDIRL